MVHFWAILCGLLLVSAPRLSLSTENVEAFDNIEQESSNCEDRCDSNDQTTGDACKRGCRLFSISEWVTSNLTEVEGDCFSACKEAYQEESTSNRNACINGCQFAKPIAEKRKAKLSELEPSIHLQYVFPLSNLYIEAKNPFEDMFNEPSLDDDGMMNQMMGAMARSFSRMNSMMYSSARATQIIEVDDGDNHEIVIIEFGDPEINTPHPNEKKVMLNTDSGGSKTTLDDIIESNLQTNANSKPFFYEFNFMNEFKDEKPDDSYWRSVKSKFQEWWDCFSKKSSLPELVLLLFWLSTLLLLLAACALQFQSSKKMSVNGDLAYITDTKGKLPSHVKYYPVPEGGKKSPYFMASVVGTREEKVPLNDPR
ncbi:uncharacterized protein LOC143459098 [Clavelina lepadiformis]|uniref:Uncharacterized protein n=1 Tax=Clavelina lepadiformis TaxID=159417 RepID=A0ABP0FNX6_CLALP